MRGSCGDKALIGAGTSGTQARSWLLTGGSFLLLFSVETFHWLNPTRRQKTVGPTDVLLI